MTNKEFAILQKNSPTVLLDVIYQSKVKDVMSKPVTTAKKQTV